MFIHLVSVAKKEKARAMKDEAISATKAFVYAAPASMLLLIFMSIILPQITIKIAVNMNPNTLTMDMAIPESLGLLTSFPTDQQTTPMDDVTPIKEMRMNSTNRGGFRSTRMLHAAAVVAARNIIGIFLLLILSEIPPTSRQDMPEINNTIETMLAA